MTALLIEDRFATPCAVGGSAPASGAVRCAPHRTRGRADSRNRDFIPSACANRAFTLIELLVVIAIIGILAALLLPVLNRGKESGRSVACVSNLHQIGLALQIYVDANHNLLPIMRDRSADTNAPATPPSPDIVLKDELGNVAVLRCPSDRQNIFETTGSSYSWNSLLNGQNADKPKVLGMNFSPHAIPVFFDKQGFHAARGPNKAVNYLYADLHIKDLLTIEGSLPP